MAWGELVPCPVGSTPRYMTPRKQLLVFGTASLLALSVLGCGAPMRFGRPIEKGGAPGFRTYKQQGQVLNNKSMVETLERTPASADAAKTARGWSIFGSLLAYSGGALIGWPLGSEMGGQEPNWNLAYAGAGLAAGAIAVGFIAGSHLDDAVDAYNARAGVRIGQRHKLQPTLAVTPREGAADVALGLRGRF